VLAARQVDRLAVIKAGHLVSFPPPPGKLRKDGRPPDRQGWRCYPNPPPELRQPPPSLVVEIADDCAPTVIKPLAY